MTDRVVFSVGVILVLIGAIGAHCTDQVGWLRFFDNLHWTSGTITAAILAWRGWRSATPEQQRARGWFALGFAGYATGQLFYDAQVATQWNPFPAPADAFYLVLGPCCMIGLLSTARRLPVSFWFDLLALVVAVISLTLALYLPRQGDFTVLQVMVLSAYPITLLSAACLTALVAIHHHARPTWGWLLFLFGILCNGSVWMHWNALALVSANVDGSWFNLSFSIISLALGLAARSWHLDEAANGRWRYFIDLLEHLLPLLLVSTATIAVALAVFLVDLPETTRWSLLVGSSVIVGVMVIRQGLTAASLRQAQSSITAANQVLAKRTKELEREIRDRTKAEMALRDSEIRYRDLFDQMVSGFAICEMVTAEDEKPRNYRFLQVNPAFERLSGLPVAITTGRTVREVLPQIEDRWLEFFARVAFTGNPDETENYSRDLDRWFEVRSFSPSRGLFAIMFNDVTQRKRAEDSLRAREEDLSITLQSIGDAVIATDARGCITLMNALAERLTGWTSAEARGRLLIEVFHILQAGTRAPVENPVDQVLRIGEVIGLANHTILVSKDGNERQIADSAAPIRSADGSIRGVVLVFRDVTEQYRLEDQFRHAQKMETIGRLAGGVAHDFNNLLSGIFGYAGLLETRIAGDAKAQSHLDGITSAAMRAAELTKHLLTFSRKGSRQEAVVDIHRIINEVIGILGRTLDRRITIVSRLDAECPRVMGDATQLQSALLNLAINARDAMPESGTLTISSSSVSEHAPWRCVSGKVMPAGPYLRVTVQDTGHGMTPDVMTHLFEPFFTTKPVGMGTGLGLAAVYGIVQDHHGCIRAESTVGVGSTFIINLPVTLQETTSVYASPGITSGRGHLLVVEDEALLRRLSVEQLTSLGYTVDTAEDGAKALELFRTRPDRFAAVILDVMMPGMSGTDVLRQMLDLHPSARVLMVSGYGADAAALTEAGAAAFLAKPFTLAELSHALAKLLRAKAI